MIGLKVGFAPFAHYGIGGFRLGGNPLWQVFPALELLLIACVGGCLCGFVVSYLV